MSATTACHILPSWSVIVQQPDEERTSERQT